MTGFKLNKAQERAMDTLVSDATYCALGGGSRSGKTVLFVRAIIIRAMRAPGSRHVIFRFRFNAVKSSVVLETLPKVVEMCFPDLKESLAADLDKSDWYWKLPNGSEIWFCGLDDKERAEKVLGKEYATIFFNESSQMPYQSIVTAMSRLAQKTSLKLKIYADFNPPSKKHWTYLLFIEKRNPDTKQPLLEPMNYSFFLINPYDNKENLAPEYLKVLEDMPEKARNRFLLGKFADDSDGALWSDELLAQNRVLDADRTPEMQRIVIAVDPSGCSGPEDERSDEIGICVVGLGTNGHGYLIEDLSGRFGPAEWGIIVNEAYRRHGADMIVGEANFGGSMVEHTLRTVNSEIPYQEVRASRGKVVRAEPISALYNQAKIHHIGYFPELEDQLCSMTVAGYQGLKSPDRADAAIWGFTALFPSLTMSEAHRNWTPPKVITSERSAGRYSRRR
ncbi:phage terminase large subunit [Litorivivens sp.]|uniref:phage terminase large subunit n=1 Tax=Litorivivens sp. TaxID=2020868 RepID=UPI003567958C